MTNELEGNDFRGNNLPDHLQTDELHFKIIDKYNSNRC